MTIIKYPTGEAVEQAMKANEPMLAVISFDGKTAVISQIDDAVEHHILLMKAGFKSTDIDKFFRIVLDKDGADWTFVCPPDYKGIKYKSRRIEEFYKDGFSVISEFLKNIGYFVSIDIPKRYRRHLIAMNDDTFEQ